MSYLSIYAYKFILFDIFDRKKCFTNDPRKMLKCSPISPHHLPLHTCALQMFLQDKILCANSNKFVTKFRKYSSTLSTFILNFCYLFSCLFLVSFVAKSNQINHLLHGNACECFLFKFLTKIFQHTITLKIIIIRYGDELFHFFPAPASSEIHTSIKMSQCICFENNY